MPIPGVYQKVAEGQQAKRSTGTVENPKKFKGQDFNTIRDTCLNRRQLFEDDAFPASLYSIGQHLLSQDKLLSIKWKRPTEIHQDPRFLVDGVSIFDIMQGEIGDCWVLSAVGALTLHRKFLENVIPKDQEFTHKYAGIFHFRFWQYGEWVDVVVDDRLPILNGKYLSVQPRSSNEFWPSLLEKAYAKLRGSYQNLHWGFISEALVDFTGGVQMDFNLSNPPPDLRDIVLAAARSGSLMGCTTPGDLHTGNMELQNGLVKGHAYTVTNGVQIEYKNGTEDIVQLWNPWGQGEWNGRWSDRATQWDRVRPELKKKLNVQRNDGEFWMSCTDFLQNFSQVNICDHIPGYLDFSDPQHVWECASYYNQWVRGSTAGGCNTAEDMWKNPQYVITVSERQAVERGYNVTVAMMQNLGNERKYNPRWLPIGFAFCRVIPKEAQNGNTGPRPLSLIQSCCAKDHSKQTQGTKNGSQLKFSRQQATDVIDSGLERAREVTRSFIAPPGTYVILPYTENKGQESEFLLRIFTRTAQVAAEFHETQTGLKVDNPSVNSHNSSVSYQSTKSTPRDSEQNLYNNRTTLEYQNSNGAPTHSERNLYNNSTSLEYQNSKAAPRHNEQNLYNGTFLEYQKTKSASRHSELNLNGKSTSLESQKSRTTRNSEQNVNNTRASLEYQNTKATPAYSEQNLYSNSAPLEYQNTKTAPRQSEQNLYNSSAPLDDFGSRLSVDPSTPKAVLKKYQDGSYEDLFGRFVNQGSEMYPEQLQMLLNEVVIADQTLIADRSTFSLDSCRGILMLMDLNANGRLNLQEFGRLWKRLNMCKAIFRSIDVNQTGYIDRYGLSQAIEEVGFVISNAIMDVMILRYANYSRKLTFADFVCCMIRLETVTKVFQNLTKDGRGIYLSSEEWMQIIMSS
ncbi:calpain-13-like isoform X3 [Hyperolius riggenbachi]|uniref:calpain-13-like isoform X3 n=1 Tax=Hyperolius riggenbachi TaxID=752182 RepID=UPI0035A38E71